MKEMGWEGSDSVRTARDKANNKTKEKKRLGSIFDR